MSIAAFYKKVYGGLSPSTWWLSLVMLINRSGTMVIPFMTLYLTDARHFSVGQAGFVMATFGLGAICGSFLGGRLTDRFGFYNIQLSALLCGGIMFIVLGQMQSYLTICICTYLLATLNEAFRPANSTAIAHYSKEENRTRSYSLNRLSINIGWALGSALGGLIASHNYQLLFWVDGLTNIGAAFLLRAVLAPARNEHTPSKADVQYVKDKTNSAYRDKVYLAFIVLVTAYSYCFFQLFTMVPLFYKQRLHLTPFFIGCVMSVNGVIIALSEMALVFKLEGRKQSLYFVSIGTALTGVSFIIFNLLPWQEALAISSMLVVTLGEMLSMPFMNTFWIQRSSANNRGQYAGLYSVAWSVAQVLGPSTGGQIAQHLGFTVLWWYIGGLCMLVSFGFYRLRVALSH